MYSVKFLQNRQLTEIEELHPTWSTYLSVFTLKTGHQNLLFSIDFIGLRHNSSLIFYFPGIISILEKIGLNILIRFETMKIAMIRLNPSVWLVQY